MDQRSGGRDLVRQHFQRKFHAEGAGGWFERIDTAPRRASGIAAARRRLRAGHAQVRDEHLDREAPRNVQRLFCFSHGRRALILVRRRQR